MHFGFRGMLPNGLIVWVIPITLLLIIGISIYMIVKNKKQKNQYKNDSSLNILNERFAKGDIDVEEYEEKKKNLEINL